MSLTLGPKFTLAIFSLQTHQTQAHNPIWVPTHSLRNTVVKYHMYHIGHVTRSLLTGQFESLWSFMDPEIVELSCHFQKYIFIPTEGDVTQLSSEALKCRTDLCSFSPDGYIG